MTTLTTLRDIERRLSEAKGPDREIDWAIWNAFDPAWPCDEFTASIDAAVALCERVLPGWTWRVATCSVSDDAWIMPDFNHPEYGEGFRRDFPDEAQRDPVAYFNSDVDLRSSGKPAIALCLALVRALISKAEAGE